VSDPGGGAITVVLCDDVPQLRMLLRYAFEEQGDLDVVGEAGDGHAGVEAIERTRPDAVVLDLSMPGLDGLEVIPRIRGISPATAIIVFSGFTADRMAREAVSLGADGYVEKGADIDDVAAAVRAAVERRRAA
jgi:DNA-binding NarL/FixJ family response regulator